MKGIYKPEIIFFFKITKKKKKVNEFYLYIFSHHIDERR